MKVLKFTMLLAGCIFISSTFAQTLKPKQVPLANWNDDQGLMSYTYYEDPKTGDYIPHGKFSYKLAQGTYYKEDAIGSLKNGKRDGIWTYKVTRLDDLAFDVNWTGTIQLSFGYKEGKPNGLWTYSNIQKYRTKSRGVWLPYEFQFAPNETLSVMFADGHPSGIYSFADNSFSNKVKITGQFNTKGYINGTWLLNYSDEQSEFVFNNGILVKKVVRDLPSGKVSKSYFASENELKLHAAFLAGTLTKEEIVKNRIKIDTIDSDEYISCDERKTLYNKYFNWVNIGGDNLFDANRGEYLGGKAIEFTLVDLVKLAENKTFKTLEDNFRNSNDSKTRDTLELKKAFDEFYKENRLSLTDEDYQKSLAIQNELKQVVINRVEEGIKKWMLVDFPFLDTRNFENIAKEFEFNLKIYNTLVNESKYDDVVLKLDSAYLERIKKTWNDGVLKLYSDSTRFTTIHAKNMDWMKDFNKLELPAEKKDYTVAFFALYNDYYLNKVQELIKDKKFYELNLLADRFKLAQYGYKILYNKVSSNKDVSKIVNSINEADSYDSLISIFIAHYKEFKSDWAY
jgi:hypothetical protein